jgi:hypothetical protein
MIKRIVVIVGLLISLVACNPSITSGKVVNKDYNPGHYKTTSSTSCSSRAKDGTCKNTVTNNRQDWVKPVYRLQLSNGKDSNWIIVTEGSYASTGIGSCYAVETC